MKPNPYKERYDAEQDDRTQNGGAVVWPSVILILCVLVIGLCAYFHNFWKLLD